MPRRGVSRENKKALGAEKIRDAPHFFSSFCFVRALRSGPATMELASGEKNATQPNTP